MRPSIAAAALVLAGAVLLSPMLAQGRPGPAMPSLSARDPDAPAQALPDLTIGTVYVTIDPLAWCHSDRGELGTEVTVANVGDAPAGQFVVRVNGASHLLVSLDAHEARELWFRGYVTGERGDTVAEVDVGDRVRESREDNNVRRQLLPIPTPAPTCTPSASPTPPTGTPPPLPDFAPELDYWWDCPCWPCPGQEPEGAACVANRGDGAAPAAVHLLDFGNVREIIPSAPLGPGGQACRGIPSVSLVAIADLADAVAESDETNNRREGRAPTYTHAPSCTFTPTGPPRTTATRTATAPSAPTSTGTPASSATATPTGIPARPTGTETPTPGRSASPSATPRWGVFLPIARS